VYKFKKDKFQKNRGGTSKVLDITCNHCGKHVTYYQKDGPGMLKRMYIDRFIDFNTVGNKLGCPSCKYELGILINYKKENRAAYRLFAKSVSKKIVSQNDLI
jgi:thiol-disulfide isomerase/thioredoxin